MKDYLIQLILCSCIQRITNSSCPEKKPKKNRKQYRYVYFLFINGPFKITYCSFSGQIANDADFATTDFNHDMFADFPVEVRLVNRINIGG